MLTESLTQFTTHRATWLHAATHLVIYRDVGASPPLFSMPRPVVLTVGV